MVFHSKRSFQAMAVRRVDFLNERSQDNISEKGKSSVSFRQGEVVHSFRSLQGIVVLPGDFRGPENSEMTGVWSEGRSLFLGAGSIKERR